MQADPQNVPKDHIGIFRFQYRPRGKPILYCFYATPKGGIPITKENAWYNYISGREDLLNKFTTRSEVKHLSDKVIDLSKATLISSKPSKKRKLLDYTNNDNDRNIFSPPSSSAPPQQIVSPTTNIYWTSTEARKLFNAREGESTMEAVSTQISILKN
jgi:hypothetical protein